jgi:hypothetical protein
MTVGAGYGSARAVDGLLRGVWVVWVVWVVGWFGVWVVR